MRLPLRRPTALFWCYLAYLVVVLVSVLKRPVPGYGLAEAILPLTGAAILFLFEMVPMNRRAQESTLLLLVGTGLIAAAYGILQNFGVEWIPRVELETERQVLTSFFGHSNFMASFLGPIVFLAAYFLGAPFGQRPRVVAAVAIGVSLLCSYWAGTRAATVATIAGALFLVRWRWPHVTISRTRTAALAGTVLAVVAIATLWGQFGGRHRETLLRRLSSHREISNRMFFWLVGAEMIRDHPLLGIGYGRYNAEFWYYCERAVKRPGSEPFTYILREMKGLNPGHAHNDLIEIACETGVLGTAAFVGVWILALAFCHAGVRHGTPADQRLARHLRAALIFVLVDSQFGFPLRLPASALLFWFLLGSVAQTYRRVARQKADAPAEAAEPADLAAEPVG